MKMNSMKHILGGGILAAVIVLISGCGRNETATTDGVSGGGAPEWLLTEAPADSQELLAAIADAGPEGMIVATGRVGGMMHPITEGYAAFVVADEVVHFCDETEDDHCATPWDACCESPDVIKASRAVVQIADADGNPLPVDLRKVADLRENDTVHVIGRLVKSPDPDSRLITATALFVDRSRRGS